MLILVQGFQTSLLVMVQVMEAWVVMHESGILNIAVYFQASLCGQFVIRIY